MGINVLFFKYLVGGNIYFKKLKVMRVERMENLELIYRSNDAILIINEIKLLCEMCFVNIIYLIEILIS